jgi:hypothetical protein
MNIFALTATASSNYFASKSNQMNLPLVPAVTMARNVYCPPSLPFQKAVKAHLPRLAEDPPVAHAPPQVVTPAEHSSLMRETEESSN